MLIGYKRGQASIILRLKILDSSATTGAGLASLTFSSAGLIVSTIADNEATATTYTQAGGTIETVSTLGTYAAPTATKCRFKEVDATNHPGIYEIHVADARFAVSNTKSLLVSVSGATNAAETDVVIPLRDLDPYDSVRAGLTAMPNAAADAAGGLPISDAGGLDLDDLPTTAEFEARTLAAAAYFDASTDTVDVGKVSGDSVAADNLETAFDGGSYNVGGGAAVAASVTAAVTTDAASRTASKADVSGMALAATALSNVVWTDAKAAYLDAAISSRSTYAGADTAGTTTLLGRLSAVRAGLLDNLDAAISSLNDLDAAAIRAALGLAAADLDNQIAAIPTTAMRGTDGANTTTPPTVGDIADSVWDELLGGHSIEGSAGEYVTSMAGNVWGFASRTLSEYSTGNGFTSIPWNAAWDAEVQSEVADALAAWDKTGFSLAADQSGVTIGTVTLVTTVTTLTGKDGFALASSGLDQISAAEPTEKPTTWPGWMMWMVQKSRRAVKTTTNLLVKTEAGDTVTTQAITDDGEGNETLGPPT